MLTLQHRTELHQRDSLGLFILKFISLSTFCILQQILGEYLIYFIGVFQLSQSSQLSRLYKKFYLNYYLNKIFFQFLRLFIWWYTISPRKLVLELRLQRKFKHNCFEQRVFRAIVIFRDFSEFSGAPLWTLMARVDPKKWEMKPNQKL